MRHLQPYMACPYDKQFKVKVVMTELTLIFSLFEICIEKKQTTTTKHNKSTSCYTHHWCPGFSILIPNWLGCHHDQPRILTSVLHFVYEAYLIWKFSYAITKDRLSMTGVWQIHGGRSHPFCQVSVILSTAFPRLADCMLRARRQKEHRHQFERWILKASRTYYTHSTWRQNDQRRLKRVGRPVEERQYT